ncbi:MAG: coenzyme F420-0:L-glutamate ligase [Candidatus Bathyarchaeia archaeon]
MFAEVSWSKWDLLGFNIYSEDLIKLAPENPSQLQRKSRGECLGEKVEVIIYGDGAYLNPSTTVYESADPVCSFGRIEGLTEGGKALNTNTLHEN